LINEKEVFYIIEDELGYHMLKSVNDKLDELAEEASKLSKVRPFDNKLILLMAVLEKKAGYLLQQQDVYVKVSGGVKIDDPAVDLGVVMAVASSFKDIAVNMNDCFIGEVGLTGEVRRVSRIEQRINEAKKHGFKRVIVPIGNMKNSDFPDGIEIIPVKDIRECLDIAFSNVF